MAPKSIGKTSWKG